MLTACPAAHDNIFRIFPAVRCFAGVWLKQVEGRFNFTADEIRIRPAKDEDGQLVLGSRNKLTGRREVDEVFKAIVKEADRSRDSPRFFAQRKINADRFFEIEIWIADLKGVCRDVWAVGEELCISRGTLRVGERKRDAVLLVQIVSDTA